MWGAGRFDGWSEHFSFVCWQTAAESVLSEYGVDSAWYTSRERPRHEVLPWDHLDVGLVPGCGRNGRTHWRSGNRALRVRGLCRLRGASRLNAEIQVGPSGGRLELFAPADEDRGGNDQQVTSATGGPRRAAADPVREAGSMCFCFAPGLR